MNAYSRRTAIQIGAGLFGLNLPQVLRAASSAKPGQKEMSCIFLFLAGGPSQFETFDPKPDAPAEIRGPWNPISTNVPGIHICEKLPLLAARADKLAIIRSWQGTTGGHDIGSQEVASGFFPEGRGKQFFPNFGCLLNALYGNKVPGVPSHFGLPVAARYTNPPGYLGAAYDAFNIKGDPTASDLEVNKLSVASSRFDERRSILTQMENVSRLTDTKLKAFEAHDKFADEALQLLTSGTLSRALKLDQEPLPLRESYGLNIYGQRVLLARRLIEAGARFVTINQAVQGGLFGEGTTNGTWDNHHLSFDAMMSHDHEPANIPNSYKWHRYVGPGNIPQLDMSLSTLLDDLEARGLLDTTLVVAMGEFGRTPRINKDSGRDHYPNAGCVVMAGAGVKRGVVIGATDRKGSAPATRPWTPADVAASIYHAMGVDPHRTYFPRLPRPTPISSGQVIDGLFG